MTEASGCVAVLAFDGRLDGEQESTLLIRCYSQISHKEYYMVGFVAIRKSFKSLSRQHLNLSGSDDPGAVGTNEPGLVLRLERVDHLDHVVLRDSLSDGHDQGNLSVKCLENGLGRPGRRHIDDGGIGLNLSLGLNTFIIDITLMSF